ncbi:hypothetical protein ACFVXG_36075 [Kitasatospora sp. NPDC058162]|uniref:hypothetical protein n=1 Tax=Kitasatospora sp. NPDC058162 TaxID=3346362 RepID=UPI0036DB5499
MNVPELLEAAGLLAPAAAAGGGPALDDVWDDLVRDDWESALTLLEELRDPASPPPGARAWEDLAEAAAEARLPRSAAWCHWRAFEARHGSVRAELTLPAPGQGPRSAPFAGAGVLRPPWDLGHRDAHGRPVLDIAVVWVEGAEWLGPGQRAVVRLAPLDPARWRHLRPGRVIALYEGALATATAVVLEVRALEPAGPAA